MQSPICSTPAVPLPPSVTWSFIRFSNGWYKYTYTISIELLNVSSTGNQHLLGCSHRNPQSSGGDSNPIADHARPEHESWFPSQNGHACTTEGPCPLRSAERAPGTTPSRGRKDPWQLPRPRQVACTPHFQGNSTRRGQKEVVFLTRLRQRGYCRTCRLVAFRNMSIGVKLHRTTYRTPSSMCTCDQMFFPSPT